MKPTRVKTLDWYHYNVLFFLEHVLGYAAFQKHFGKAQKKLFSKIGLYLSKGPTPIIRQVEEVDKDMSKEEFMRLCYKPGQPKVFRGAAAHWEAIKSWSPDFFANNYGDQKILLNDNAGLTDQEFEELTLRDYIIQFNARTLKYLRFSDIVNNNQELKSDFDMSWIRKYNLPYSWGEDTKMFMGAKGTLTPLHVGFSDFLFVQVMGRKKWILYPTSDRLFLDARTDRTLHFYSKANPYADSPDFPLFKYAQPYEVYLEPGDVLWVPSLVWHHVENLDDSIGIRCGRSSIFSAAKSSKLLTALIFMATKPNLITHALTRRLKKKDFYFSKSWQDTNQSIWDRLFKKADIKKTIS